MALAKHCASRNNVANVPGSSPLPSTVHLSCCLPLCMSACTSSSCVAATVTERFDPPCTRKHWASRRTAARQRTPLLRLQLEATWNRARATPHTCRCPTASCRSTTCTCRQSPLSSTRSQASCLCSRRLRHFVIAPRTAAPTARATTPKTLRRRAARRRSLAQQIIR